MGAVALTNDCVGGVELLGRRTDAGFARFSALALETVARRGVSVSPSPVRIRSARVKVVVIVASG